MALTFVFQTAAKSNSQADASVPTQQEIWAFQINAQIDTASKVGLYATFVNSDKLTTDISTALTGKGYTVGSDSDGKTEVSWP